MKTEFDLTKRLDRSKSILILILKRLKKVYLICFHGVSGLFSKVDLNIPNVTLLDVWGLGKVKGNRPVMLKFISSRWVRFVFTKIAHFRKLNVTIS